MSKIKNSELLDRLELNSLQPPKASLIWLHGLGASNNDFVPVAKILSQLTPFPLRFVFPQAPQRPVTINNGFVMPAWYDITSFEKEGDIDHQGISISVDQVKTLIQAEQEKGFSAQQIILVGFSQGAVIVLNTLLSSQEELGGVIALSGYLPPRALSPHSHQTPIFIGHGQNDETVPCIYGQAAYETLKKAGYTVTWKTYPMTHSVCDEEIRDLAEWLKKVLN